MNALWPAIIASFASVAAAWISSHNSAKLKEIRTVVNGRLDKALEEIERLKTIIEKEENGHPPQN